MIVLNSESQLKTYMHTLGDQFIDQGYKSLDAIVVEGYDGVGKGVILNILSEMIGVTPYRPDYNLWQKYDHRQIDRWKVSGFFWDVFTHFKLTSKGTPMLFDRGIISGAVYNHDMSIAENYQKLLGESKVLHILVTCEKNSFCAFQKVRNPSISEFDLGYLWSEYGRYTEDYFSCLDIAKVDYIVYDNKFNEELARNNKNLCSSCGHYNHGFCRHPKVNYAVSPDHERCELSKDKEIQDMEVEENVAEMHSM